MNDIRIFHAWIGDGLMGVGLTEKQARDDAREEGEKAGLWGDDGALRGAFDTEEDYMAALDVGASWLSECGADVTYLLDTREIE